MASPPSTSASSPAKTPGGQRTVAFDQESIDSFHREKSEVDTEWSSARGSTAGSTATLDSAEVDPETRINTAANAKSSGKKVNVTLANDITEGLSAMHDAKTERQALAELKQSQQDSDAAFLSAPLVGASINKKKIVADENDMWGELDRRHFSLQADGKRLTKICADFTPSTALAKVSVFHTFSCEILIHKTMRSTSIGLAMTAIAIDSPWHVPLLLKSHEQSKQAALDKLEAQLRALEQQQEAARVALSIKGGSVKDKIQMGQELAARDQKRALQVQVKLAQKELEEATHEKQLAETQLRDKFGPKVWLLTSTGDLYEGGMLVVSTGKGFKDGDTVTVDLEAGWLSFLINGERVPGSFQCKIEMRTAVAVHMENKGASVEILSTSLDEFAAVLNDAATLEEAGFNTEVLRQQIEEERQEALSRNGSPLRCASGAADGEADENKPLSQQELVSIVTSMAKELESRWEFVDTAFRALDMNNDGMISKREFRQVMAECGMHMRIGRQLDRIWGYLDSDGSGAMTYAEFLKRVCFAEAEVDTGDEWGLHHADIVTEGVRCTNNSCCGRAALLKRGITSGRLSVEVKIERMTGTLFVGAMQVVRRVSIKKGRAVSEVTTMPLDLHWYFMGDQAELQTWYLSDLGVMRNGGKTIAHIGREIKTGDSIGMDIDMHQGTLTFTVNGRVLPETITGVTGDVCPAVFIEGDEGDNLTLTKVDYKGYKVRMLASAVKVTAQLSHHANEHRASSAEKTARLSSQASSSSVDGEGIGTRPSVAEQAGSALSGLLGGGGGGGGMVV